MPPKLSLIVDERERALYDALYPYLETFPTMDIRKQTMTIGDMAIVREGEEKPVLLIERKSLSDLLASIQDGRYKEQSQRLLHASGMDPHRIVYLIEGPIGGLPVSQRQKVYSAMTSISLGKGFSVMRTWSIQESAEWLVRLVDKLTRSPELLPNAALVVSDATTVTQMTMTAVKKNNITPDNIGEILLVQIPGISSVTAKAILASYENSFTRVLRAVESKDPVLQTIQYQAADGKMRKISKGIVGKLQELFVS